MVAMSMLFTTWESVPICSTAHMSLHKRECRRDCLHMHTSTKRRLQHVTAWECCTCSDLDFSHGQCCHGATETLTLQVLH